MKILIAAILIVAANSAAATGFSPWANTRVDDTNVAAAAAAENAGFGPWRERAVRDEIRIAPKRGIVVNPGELNGFRPWS